MIRVGFLRFGRFNDEVACISCFAHSIKTLPCSSAMPTPPNCESWKQSKLSLISVISPMGSDFGGIVSSNFSGCGVDAAVGDICSDKPDKLVKVGSVALFDCELDNGGVVTVGAATGTADGAAGEKRFQFGGGV